jgi:hypothetical protein
MNFNVVEERTEQAAVVHAKYLGFEKKHMGKRVVTSIKSLTITDDELIDRMLSARNGTAVKALWHGDTSAYEGNHSCADAALCAHLAFWTGGDAERMDRLFRISGLYREKWDRLDYRERTIRKAIELTSQSSEYSSKSKAQADEGWERPIPFHSYDLNPFPTQCLPEWVGDYVRAVAEATQTSEDMAGVLTLGALSIPFAATFRIEGNLDWEEPLNLYCTTIAAPGERKSAVMSRVMKPIYDFEFDENEFNKTEMAKNQMEKEILKGEVSKLQKQATMDNTEDNRQLAMEKAAELSNLEVLSQVRFTCDDVSPEKLVGIMRENKGRIAIVSAEGGIFGMMDGRYSDKTNIDVFLKGHSGDLLRVDRIGRESEYVKEPTLSMVLAIQPEILRGIMNSQTFRGRGLTARFLYSLPQSKVGFRKIECESIPKEVSDAYSANFKYFLGLSRQDAPKVLKLDPEAYNRSVAFAKKLEPRLVNDLQPIADWGSKLHGAVLRIAGILHLSEHANHTKLDDAVSADIMDRATDIGKYFINQAKAAFELMGADKNIDNCKYVLKWIKKQKDSVLKKRDIFRGNRGRFKITADIEPTLRQLCEFGYLRVQEPESQGAGRKPDLVYLVNPHIKLAD